MTKIHRALGLLILLVLCSQALVLTASAQGKDLATFASRNKDVFDQACGQGATSPGYFEPVLDVGWMAVRNLGFFPLHEGAQILPVRVDSPLLAQKEMIIYFWSSTAKEKKNELVLFFPGLFQTGDNLHPKQMLDILLPQGYDVLVVPNSFSYLYDNFPRFMVGRPVEEGQVALSIIKASLAQVSTNYTQIHTVAMSAGSITALAANRQDSDHILTGKLILLSPSPDFQKAIHRLDAIIESSAQNYAVLHPFQRANADNFSASLPSLIRVLNKNYRYFQSLGEDATLYPAAARTAFAAMDPDALPQLTYTQIMDRLNYGAAENSDPKLARLDYWLPRLTGARRRPVILLTCNDYLADRADWYRLPLDLKSRATIRPTGGHNGYFSDAWFAEWIVQTLQAK